jgi:hypothetical protein
MLSSRSVETIQRPPLQLSDPHWLHAVLYCCVRTAGTAHNMVTLLLLASA